MSKYYFAFALMFILLTSMLFGQVNISKISPGIGVVSNFQSKFWTKKLHAINYELSFGGKFVYKGLEWDLHLGYTDDGIDKPFNFPELITHSYSNLSVGGRLLLYVNDLENNIPIPVFFIAGLSSNFIDKKYVGGMLLDESIGNSTAFNYMTYELGVGIAFYKINNFRFWLNYSTYFPFSRNYEIKNDGQYWNVKLGADYFF